MPVEGSIEYPCRPMRRSRLEAKENAPTIQIGEGQGIGREIFLGGRLAIHSPRGVRGADRALLSALPLEMSGRVLVIGTREAIAALAVASLWPPGEVHIFNLDSFEHERAIRSLGRNPSHSVRTHLAADLPEPGTFDWVLLAIRHTSDAMLTGELLRQAHGALKPRGKLLAATDNPRDRWLHERVMETFGAATILDPVDDGAAYVARKHSNELRQRDFGRTFEATLFGQTVRLFTRPGVFSHGRLDDGALALSEVTELKPGTTLLDMGCGSGAIGIASARVSETNQSVLVDSNTRAVRCALRNAAENNVLGRTLVAMSHDFSCLRNQAFDLVLANPPYFGDWRIAELFIREGHRVLRPGGSLYLVTKSVDEPTDILRRTFGGSTRSERRGYSVLRSLKRDSASSSRSREPK